VPNTTHPTRHLPQPHPKGKNQYQRPPRAEQCQLIDVPPLSNPHDTNGRGRPPGHPQTSPRPQTTRNPDASAP
jgi:hypothetical protein